MSFVFGLGLSKQPFMSRPGDDRTAARPNNHRPDALGTAAKFAGTLLHAKFGAAVGACFAALMVRLAGYFEPPSPAAPRHGRLRRRSTCSTSSWHAVNLRPELGYCRLSPNANFALESSSPNRSAFDLERVMRTKYAWPRPPILNAYRADPRYSGLFRVESLEWLERVDPNTGIARGQVPNLSSEPVKAQSDPAPRAWVTLPRKDQFHWSHLHLRHFNQDPRQKRPSRTRRKPCARTCNGSAPLGTTARRAGTGTRSMAT
jgi:hypothetical protein